MKSSTQRVLVIGAGVGGLACAIELRRRLDARGMGDKTVLVDARLYDFEPLAYKFMVNFANDNNLQIEWMGDAPL